MCDYSLEAYRSRPAQLGERYETHVFESYSVGFVAPGDPSTAVCMECDMKLRLEGIPERVQRAKRVLANEDVTFARIEKGVHHDGVRFGNGLRLSASCYERKLPQGACSRAGPAGIGLPPGQWHHTCINGDGPKRP